jgi:uncharacterized protein YciI
MELEEFTAVLLVLADEPPALTAAEASALQDAHLGHLAQLHDDGLLLAAGPLDDPRLRGLCVFRGPAADVRPLVEADPAVRAGRLRAEVLTWWVPSGALALSTVPFPRTVAELDD